MLDITEKRPTLREATVDAKVLINPKVIRLIRRNKIPKGRVLEAAKLAGIMAAKYTPLLIPFCHPIPIEYVNVDFSVTNRYIKVTVIVKGQAKTGVEMEAFTAASVACLTIYDMCKALDRGIIISEIKLLKKSGGKSGAYVRK
ncbi:MAG: cyclic pyranopterin monophosphate synthase MoaC [Candidatus Omnitrophica bacterium]|nr:cyclic pyranopterin monophosphate synthase MoaC [Candidatus Omnitrophota bacterium]